MFKINEKSLTMNVRMFVVHYNIRFRLAKKKTKGEARKLFGFSKKKKKSYSWENVSQLPFQPKGTK